MGSSNSHNKYHGGVIQFEQPFYYPGNYVQGTIYLNIMDMFTTKGVELDIKCVEGVKALEDHQRQVNSDGQSRTITETREFKDKQVLFQIKNFLPNFQSNISIGQYAYPFSFVIPPHLPGSFEYYTDRISAYIKYQVKVKILPFNDKDKVFKFSTILIVRQTSSTFNYPTNLTDTKKITTWCFFDKGTATLNASYQKNYFAKDEVVQMQCNLDNTRCVLDSTAIRLQLFQKITLRIKGTSVKYFTRLVAQSAANDRCLAGQDTVKFLSLPIEDVDNPVFRHLDKCKHKNLFSDPSTIAKLQATCKSNLLECEYFLRATTDYDSMLCCSSPPTIEIPIVIYIPHFTFDFNRFRPENWSPQVLPAFQINGPQPQNQNPPIMDMNPSNNFNHNQNFQMMQGGSAPMMQGGSAPMMQGGSAPMMQGGSAPMMQGGSAPMMQGGSAPMMQGGSIPMMQNN